MPVEQAARFWLDSSSGSSRPLQPDEENMSFDEWLDSRVEAVEAGERVPDRE